MTTRVLAARQMMSWRVFLLLVSVPFALALLTSRVLLTHAHAGVAAASSSHASLSPAARASISATLGAEDPAYRFDESRGTLRAGNPAQHLGILAGGAGVSLYRRNLRLGLHLQAVGYGSSLRALPSVSPQSHANRVTYSHPRLSEWYVNGPLGFEQGFTVQQGAAQHAQGPLTLAVALTGNADASLQTGGQSVYLRSPAGGSLNYGDLSVSDASGRALHAWLTLRRGLLLIHVNAGGARFPLRIDPLISEEPERKLTPTGDVNQRAGMSVALSADGSTALIGGPRGQGTGGAVWVFTRDGSEYEQTEELTVPEDEGQVPSCDEHAGGAEVTGCSFGSTLALSADGNTAIVGAPHENATVIENGKEVPVEHAGAVFVFTRTGNTWSEGVEAQSPTPTENGFFGRSVALAEDASTALVGAPGEEEGSGHAWMLAASGSSFAAVGQPLKGSGQPEARFGKSVSLSADGKVAVVGAPNETERRGAAYVFENWTGESFAERFKLTGTSAGGGTRFGFSTAVSGDGTTVLIGAPQDEADDSGAVWTFVQSSEWSQLGSKLTGPHEGDALFGYAVALSANGQTALIGAPRALEGHGDVLLYERTSEGWGEPVRKIFGRTLGEGPAVEEGRARFGASIATSATTETLLVGAPANGGHQGAAWVIGRGPTVTSVAPDGGTPEGGTSVVIIGQHLANASAVMFGSTPAESFEVQPEEPRTGSVTIEAISPPGSGKVPITVTTPIGTSEAANELDGYEYEAPLVEGVTPNNGLISGGTKVTITGKYFSGTTAVLFGTGVAKVEEVQPGKVVAITPPGAAGPVEVTVEAAAGRSTEAPKIHFRYVEAAETTGKRDEEKEEKEKEHSQSNQGSGNSSGGSSTGQSGTGQGQLQVLPEGPLHVQGCGATLLSKKIVVQQGKLALFKLLGGGNGSCSGKLRLRVKQKLGHKLVLRTIGTAVFSISSGRRVTVKVKLTRVGRSLLLAHHGRLNANLLVVKSLPLPALAQTAGVHLAPQPPKRKHKG